MSDNNRPSLPYIELSVKHGQAFRERGFTIHCWVRLPDGRYGQIHTYPGGDQNGNVSVGVNGAAQFSGLSISCPLYDLELVEEPPIFPTWSRANQVDAIERWLA